MSFYDSDIIILCITLFELFSSTFNDWFNKYGSRPFQYITSLPYNHNSIALLKMKSCKYYFL